MYLSGSICCVKVSTFLKSAGGDSRCRQRRFFAFRAVVDSDDWPGGAKCARQGDPVRGSNYRLDEACNRRDATPARDTGGFNRENGITPQTIVKPIESTLITASEADYFKVPSEVEEIEDYSPANIEATIARLEVEMRAAAKRFEFERAAELRDRIKVLRERELQVM